VSYEKIVSLPFSFHLSIIFLFLVAVVGWVSNIIALFSLDTFSGEMVIRTAGIFLTPLGSILGFF
jgi:hypothetical protein